MSAIETIKIKGFKAFPSEFELKLDGNHLLLFGENGSGKSSIYYALHCLCQSSLKQDGGKKYFNPDDNQNLLNKYSTTEDSHVLIHLLDDPTQYNISKIGYRSVLLDERYATVPIEGCFVNHQFISRFFQFRNSEQINLFPIILKDILSFYKVPAHDFHIGEMFDNLLSRPVPTKKKEKELFQQRIELFNNETKNVIENINLHASDRYNTYFKADENRDLQIRLRYDSNIDKPAEDPNEYWLKYDNILESQIVRGIETIKRSYYKKWNTPYIGLEISEKAPDGTFQPIYKPQTYFNEAKLTAIALSIRFALLDLDKAADGRFIALDDLLISLDMSNRAKVIKFLLNISDKYKIYLFTHDKAFFEYFKHKSKRHQSAKEWVYKEIYMGKNKIPYLRDSESYLGEAEHYINQHKFEIAGNFLRKEAEAFCKRFLPPKWQLTKDYTNLDLNGMIQNCKKYAYESGIADLSLFDELDDYRKFILNSSSHDSYDVVKFENEVRKCLETLKSLSKTTSKPVLKYGNNVTFTLKTPQPNVKEYKFDIQICDELRVIEIPGHPKVLSKIMINYYVHEDGVKGNKQSSNQTLKKFYDDNYKRSDKTENPDYLEGIKLVFNGLPISSLL